MQLPISAVRVEAGSARVVVGRELLQQSIRNANESAAIATLKNISSAQGQCQASAVIDVNQNGAGEYGTFAELTGRDVLRGGTVRMAPPVVSAAFRNIENGVAVRSGYCYCIVLPGQDSVPLPELAAGGPDAAVAAVQAEVVWCAYAWPVEAGVSGQRAFFIDQSGDVIACANDDGRYSGVAKRPEPDAARAANSSGKLDAPCVMQGTGKDGQPWCVVP
jgi:hypothetical protein